MKIPSMYHVIYDAVQLMYFHNFPNYFVSFISVFCRDAERLSGNMSKHPEGG